MEVLIGLQERNGWLIVFAKKFMVEKLSGVLAFICIIAPFVSAMSEMFVV